MKDGKMSKSKGNVIYPESLVNQYGLDATKYFLLKVLKDGQDGIFTPEDFVELFNTDLCNDLGNLLNRTIGMVNKYFGGIVPEKSEQITEIDRSFECTIRNSIKQYEKEMDESHICDALSEIWKIISRENKYIDETMPWVLYKEGKTKELGNVMYYLVEALRKIAILIKPAMEDTSNKMFEQLGINDKTLKEWDKINDYPKYEETKVVEKGEPLFVRLEADKEIEFLKNIIKG